MSIKHLQEQLNNIDIYLLDQILKNRYKSTEKILDAGCGSGRNLHWFYNNSYPIYGIDTDLNRINSVKNKFSKQQQNFFEATVENIPFKEKNFHHTICNAVLHFAKNEIHFNTMFSELVRVTKIKGSLFIRMTSNFGIEQLVTPISNGRYKLPDNSERFLLTGTVLKNLKNTFDITFLEPIKTVNVANKRCMTTLIFQKN